MKHEIVTLNSKEFLANILGLGCAAQMLASITGESVTFWQNWIVSTASAQADSTSPEVADKIIEQCLNSRARILENQEEGFISMSIKDDK